MEKRNFRSNKSGQVIIITALVISVLFLSTAIYVIEVGKEAPTVEPNQSNVFLDYKQQITNTMISALSNATGGNNPNILETDLAELKTVILANSYTTMLTIDYSTLNSSGYKNGLLISWNNNGQGVSSACASFVFASSSQSGNSNIEYTVNVTSSMNSSGTCRQINDALKQVNLTINVMNEGKAALARNFTFSYQNGTDWTRVDSPTVISFGNGTYKTTFNAEQSQSSNQIAVSLLCQDQRGIFEGTNLTCTDTSVTMNAVPTVSVTVNAVPTVSVTVNAVPTVSVSPTSWSMDIGQSETFTASPSGGSGNYTSYHWYVDGVVQSGATASTFSYSPGSSGSSEITLTVTDSLGTTSTQSSAASVIVSAAPAVRITPVGPLTLDVDQVQVFIATASGGSGSLSYQWYLDNSTVGSNSTSYSYTATGSSHSVACRVHDNASSPVTSNDSNAVLMTVNPALVAPSVTASLGTINQGQTSNLTSSPVSTGTSPYTYQWLQRTPESGSYSVISGAVSSSYSFATISSTVIGSWSFKLQVIDSVSSVVTSSIVSVTVNAVPTVSVSPTSWSMDIGQSETFTASPSGGSGNYTSYHWYVDGVVQSGATASTFSYSPGSSGSSEITLTVTDSLGTTSTQSSAASVIVSAAPAVRITPVGPLTLDVDQVQVFIATASGGSGSLSYQWYLDNSTVGSNSTSYSYTATGSSHSVACRVHDNASSPVTSNDSNAVLMTVNPALVAPSVTASLGTINQGQTSNLTSSPVSTGTSPYTYQWLQKDPDNSFLPISGATSDSYSFVTSNDTATGTWSFKLQITDATGAQVTSTDKSVTVN